MSKIWRIFSESNETFFVHVINYCIYNRTLKSKMFLCKVISPYLMLFTTVLHAVCRPAQRRPQPAPIPEYLSTRNSSNRRSTERHVNLKTSTYVCMYVRLYLCRQLNERNIQFLFTFTQCPNYASALPPAATACSSPRCN